MLLDVSFLVPGNGSIYVLNGLGKMWTAVLEAVPGQPLPLEGVAP